MDRKQQAARKAQEVREEVRQFVERLRRRVYGDQAYPDWGTLFSEIEELGVQIGDSVCREFVQQAVSEQADSSGQRCHAPCCPSCGSPLERRDSEPKPLLTRRGEVSWQEPQAYCQKCRKAFFPSVQSPGDSGRGPL
jgi:hypothetical protein